MFSRDMHEDGELTSVMLTQTSHASFSVHWYPARVLYSHHPRSDKRIRSLGLFSMPETELVHVRNWRCLLTGLGTVNSGASLRWQVNMGLMVLIWFVCVCAYRNISDTCIPIISHCGLRWSRDLSSLGDTVPEGGSRRSYIFILNHWELCVNMVVCVYVCVWSGRTEIVLNAFVYEKVVVYILLTNIRVKATNTYNPHLDLFRFTPP